MTLGICGKVKHVSSVEFLGHVEEVSYHSALVSSSVSSVSHVFLRSKEESIP